MRPGKRVAGNQPSVSQCLDVLIHNIGSGMRHSSSFPRKQTKNINDSSCSQEHIQIFVQ